jgi:molecular chaperone DnaK (HSP70)
VVIDGLPFRSARALTEPTAAGLSYGLGVGRAAKRVMVLDVGGGTTDVSISELSQENQRVAVTEGAQAGGNDVDRALLQWFLVETKIAESQTTLSPYESQILLRTCKNAKEEICNRWSSSAFVNVAFQHHVARLDTATFLSVADPVLKRVEAVVVHALDKYIESTGTATTRVELDEVVMVGGSTKIPPVAAMLRRVTRREELCQVHPLTAVAQGTAIHAARLSNCVPIHELQSALLLDALPYAIGVVVSASSTMPSSQLDEGEFVPVLAQYASVPAQGSVKFALADKAQTGVTVPVVERIDDGTNVPRLEKIQSFQFLLRKLSAEQLRAVSTRYVEIRIQFTEIGQLFVTVVDELDPEHQRRYKLQPSDDAAARLVASNDAPPLGLILTTLALAILYIAVKLSFHEAKLKSTL